VYWSADEVEAELARGDRLRAAGRLEEAAEAYQRAARLAPRDPRPPALLALIALSRHQVAAAQLHLTEVVRRDPTNIDAWRSLADLHERARELPQAFAAYQRITQLNPQDAGAWRQMGILHKQTGAVVPARIALRRAAELNPDDWVTQWHLGDIYLKEGKLLEAKRALDRALAHRPNDPTILSLSALATMRLDASPTGLARAEKQINRAIALSPSAFAHKTRGRIYLAQRRYKEAVQEFKTALQMEPDADNAYVYLSQAYAHLGQTALARQASREYKVRLAARIRDMEEKFRRLQNLRPESPRF
ncbi:MAG: tetratricopeptide repeat protein, partial [Abditibacteriales bacterium]|nr:tetratricopeptide repeat protein [Abditibacteriales bacterium]